MLQSCEHDPNQQRFGFLRDAILIPKDACVNGHAAQKLSTAVQVRALHEALCFVHAYPDDAEVFAQVDGMLQAIDARADLRAHRHRLVDSGIAGTDIVYPFHAPTARWLARRWGERLAIEWDAVEHPATLEGRLHLLALWSESSGLDEPPLEGRAWLDRLRGRQSDATFVIERCAAAPLTRPLSERFYDELELTLRLSAARGTPSRTRARFVAWCSDHATAGRRRGGAGAAIASGPHRTPVNPKRGRPLHAH